ncbi:MAG: serine/threonine protein kinase, partial [Gammaproteobacteria bacterium]|nr:serine/threonine protein kinase [Gammaproteobacteria bacterium]
DPSIRADVLRLLEADADPGTLDLEVTERLLALGAGGEGASAGPSLEGRVIGPYRVLHRIGEGGMGAVYLAEREDVDRRVALKLVRG